MPETEGDWESRMAERTKARQMAEINARHQQRFGEFAQWVKPDDPDGILLQIIAARCLGLSYGDPGPRLPADRCRDCWGERHVWLGNTWGVQHIGRFSGCSHSCHDGEVWIA